MPKAALTLLEHALLGLLSHTAMSGYDIGRLFASTPMAHFSSSPGAIYPALKRLEQRGLLTATLDTTLETRPRRVYSLTGAGQSALEAWLRQSVTRDELIYDGRAPTLRFALAEGHLSAEEIVTYLEGYRREVSSYLDELRNYDIRMAERHTVQERLALDYGIRGYECQADWIDHAIQELKRALRAGDV